MKWDEGSEAKSEWHPSWCKCGHLSIGHRNMERGSCLIGHCKCQKFVEGDTPVRDEEPIKTPEVKEPPKVEKPKEKVLKPGKPLVKRKK